MDKSTSDNNNKNTPKKCNLLAIVIFIAAIMCGTACSILSKTMMELQGEGIISGQVEVFQKPIFQTFGMFLGMCLGLPMHWLCIYFRVPFPGYEAYDKKREMTKDETTIYNKVTDESMALKSDWGGEEVTKLQESGSNGSINHNNYGSAAETTGSVDDENNSSSSSSPSAPKIPVWMYFFLAIPSVFDLAATVLCMMGLQYIDASIYQLLRGSGIIFVALMKQYALKDVLYSFQWVGVGWNVVSVFLVGSTAILNGKSLGEDELEQMEGTADALLGVSLVMLGALVQAMQFVFEEKVMTMDIPSPPLLLIGMEGLWGTFLCLTVVYPLVYYLPGSDHGSYEDPFNTYAMFMNSKNIQIAFVIYFFAIFGYNFFAVMVTFMLNSVWHAILDNFRPITVWFTDLFIFYVVTSSFGEPWTQWSWLQLCGTAVLLFGTSIYNAPNAGSVLLKGQWFALGIDFSREYQQIHQEEEEQKLDENWQSRINSFQVRKNSSFLGERSPHISIHTQALRGLANRTA